VLALVELVHGLDTVLLGQFVERLVERLVVGQELFDEDLESSLSGLADVFVNSLLLERGKNN